MLKKKDQRSQLHTPPDKQFLATACRPSIICYNPKKRKRKLKPERECLTFSSISEQNMQPALKFLDIVNKLLFFSSLTVPLSAAQFGARHPLIAANIIRKSKGREQMSSSSC